MGGNAEVAAKVVLASIAQCYAIHNSLKYGRITLRYHIRSALECS
jgi:hypothetical protein